MKRMLLLGLFVVLMADSMFGWGLGIAQGLSIKNAALYLIILVLAMEIALSGEKRIFELPSIHVFFGLFIAVAAFSWATSTFVGSYTDYRSFNGLVRLKGSLVDHYLFFLVFFLGARNWLDVVWLQRWILVVIAAGSIVTVMDAYNLPNLNVIEIRGDGRVTGPLGEANQYGLFVAMFLPILLARAWAATGFGRVFFGVGALFTFWVLILTVSRGAYVSLLVGSIVAVIYLKPYLNTRSVVSVFAVGVVAVLAAALMLGQEYATLIVERTVDAGAAGDAYEVSAGRTWIWATALDHMLQHPLSLLVGYGWATFREVNLLAPHNTYLGYFFELGFVGALLFVALVVQLLRHSKRAIGSGNAHGPMLYGLIGFVFGFCALLVGISFVDLSIPWYFIWAYCGLAMRGAVEALRAPAASQESLTPSNPGIQAWPGGPAQGV